MNYQIVSTLLLFVVQVNSDFLAQSSELDVAIHLTLDGRRQIEANAESTALVCETWVFAWFNDAWDELASIDITSTDITSTDIYPNSSNPKSWNSLLSNLSDEFTKSYSRATFAQLNPVVLLAFDGKERLRTNFSYDDEFSEEDILEPLRFGFRRHTPNCVSLFITVPNPEKGIEITKSIMATKTGRPHKDYFFYIGNEAAVTPLLSTEKFKDMRFKFGIMNDGISASKWWNTCEREHETLDLFSRKCDSLITNRHFLISACNIPTLVSYEHNPDGTLKWGSGTIYSMFLESAKRNNFTFHIRYADFNGASGFKKDGKWYGAVGEVFSREADIACAVAPTVYRHVINDPSITQVYMVRVFFILRPPFRTSWQSIYWPLTSDVWLLTIVTTVCLVLPAFYFSAVSYLKSLKKGSHAHLLGEVIDALYRILMEQAATWRHWTGNRIRILILIWTFFCLILRTSYSSKLIVFLSFLQQEHIPETHRELSLSSYRMYFRNYGGVAYHYTSISTDPMHKRILRKALLVNSSDECMIMALNDPHAACLDYRMGGEYAISKKLVLTPHEKTALFVGSKDTDVKIHIIWSYRKGSPWIESFDKPLLNMLAAGLYDIWKERIWYAAKQEGAAWVKKNLEIRRKLLKVKEGLSTGPKPLNLDSLFGVFLIMILGSGAGFLAFFLEFAGHCISKTCIASKRRNGNPHNNASRVEHRSGNEREDARQVSMPL